MQHNVANPCPTHPVLPGVRQRQTRIHLRIIVKELKAMEPMVTLKVTTCQVLMWKLVLKLCSLEKGAYLKVGSDILHTLCKDRVEKGHSKGVHHVVWPTSRIWHHRGAQVHSGARVGGKPWSQLRSGLRGSLVLPADFDAARDDWRLGPPMAELLRLVNYVLFFPQIDDLADPTWCLFDCIFWRSGVLQGVSNQVA